jgi:hypothetical protein
MKDSYKVIQLKGNHRLYIDYDEDSVSPNDWENETVFLVFTHRQFDVRREGFKPIDIYNSIQNKSTEYEEYYIFPLCAYIHSGVSLSLSHNGDRFDTSSTGFVLVKKEGHSEDEGRTRGKAQELAESLIITWNKYLNGQVFRYTLVKVLYYVKVFFPLKLEEEIIKDIHNSNSFEEEEDVDSCGGFYNLEDILDHIPDKLIDEELREEFKD